MARARRSRRRGGCLGPLGVVVLLMAAAAGGVFAVVAWLRAQDANRPFTAACTATVDGTTHSLAPVQSDNAALIAGQALQRGLPARAVTIALATALQESRLENLDYGDRDSVGLFQQRPSQGWGTVEQIMDPVYSTTQFYDHLLQVDGWQDLEVTVAAQAVQRSAFPDAYAQHEDRARAFASALTGWSPAALTCALPAPTAPADAAAVTARIVRDLGPRPVQVPTTSDDGTVTLVVDARGLGGADQAGRLGWAVGQWAVAVAQPLGLTQVAVQDQQWDRARVTRNGDGSVTGPSWQTGVTTIDDGLVRLTLAS